MRVNKKARRAAPAIAEAFPLFPFEDLDDVRVRTQARAYLRQKIHEAEYSPRIIRESEYVTRSFNLPDRRLMFSDQALWRRMHRHAKETMQSRESEAQITSIPEAIGYLAVQPATQSQEVLDIKTGQLSQ